MQGLSNDEIRNKHYPPFQVDLSSLMKRMNELEPMTLTQIFSGIFKGSMPRLYENENVDRDLPRRSPFICSNFVCADCAEGGVNDALASALFLTNVVSMEAGENGMLGRVGDLPREMQPREFALYVKECLRAGGVRFCDGGKPITRVAVGGGACGKLMDYAVAGGAQAFVIGDCSYDLMQRAQAIGLSLVDAGHFPTENPVAAVFADKITAAFPQVLTEVSERHADCIQFV